MPSYRESQFFRIRNGESAAGRVSPTNRRFMWPDSTIRGHDADGKAIKRKMQRGYIRSLREEAQPAGASTSRVSKCRFQFNPDQLTHRVEQRGELINYFQQDAASLTQPIMGVTNFGFQLLFDRTMEVNQVTSPTPLNTDTTLGNLWEDNSPQNVGVLHDLGTLFGVIGQGITYDTVTDLRAQTLQAARAQAAVQDQTQGEIDKIEEQGSLDSVLSPSNFGNTVFMFPTPVRIVFSSLYMVEGMVTISDVSLLKFNYSMVPMTASVNLSVQATYLGYAKKQTFFTEQLKNQISLAEEARTDESQQNMRALEELGTVGINMYPSNDPNTAAMLQPMLGAGAESFGIGYRMGLRPTKISTKEDSTVNNLFGDDVGFSFEYTGNVRVRGPYTNVSDAENRNVTFGRQVFNGNFSSGNISKGSDYRKLKGETLFGDKYNAGVTSDESWDDKYFQIAYFVYLHVRYNGKTMTFPGRVATQTVRWASTAGPPGEEAMNTFDTPLKEAIALFDFSALANGDTFGVT